MVTILVMPFRWGFFYNLLFDKNAKGFEVISARKKVNQVNFQN